MRKISYKILLVTLLILVSSCSGNKKQFKNKTKSKNIKIESDLGIKKKLKDTIDKAKEITVYDSNILIDNIKTVTFGEYPQGDMSGEVDDPIEWIVLEKKSDRALLLSKYVLDCKVFNETDEYVDWEKCSLREWLNTVFYYRAFSVDEQKLIVNAKIDNFIVDEKDFNKKLYSLNITEDKVFCLSIDDVKKYFGKAEETKFGEWEYLSYGKKITAHSTKYAQGIINNLDNWEKYSKKGIESGNLINKYGTLFVAAGSDSGLEWTRGNSYYWLRSAGKGEGVYPLLVCPTSNVGGWTANDERVGVRPAIWVSY